MTERTSTPVSHPPDHAARGRAVDTRESFIVQAPAGSGKTMLLTERFLRLLATVDEPEQVVAITFTKGAVAEMRARAMKALAAADAGNIPEKEDDRRLFEAAKLALEHAKARKWKLLEDPQQLSIFTIDSLALQIAQSTPLLSRLGPGFSPTEDASAYYHRAAALTLRSLGELNSTDPLEQVTARAALTLLQHRENKLANCTELIAAMLGNRDQWGRHFSLNQPALDENYLDNELRPRLEHELRVVVERHLRLVHEAIESSTIDSRELAELACFAATTATSEVANCSGVTRLPEPSAEFHRQWLGIVTMVLTKEGDPRKAFQGKDGLPKGPSPQKAALRAMTVILESEDELRKALHGIRELPPAKFSEEEWEVAKALFRLLLRAAIHLTTIFAESGTVDFTELGLAALAALKAEAAEAAPSDLALMLSARYRHLLVDEFQDTSRTQFEILQLLLGGWEEGDGRSLFLVGDPMQSIYLFRQAEMGLFAKVLRHGVMSVRPQNITLQVNFRSQPALIEEHNRIFQTVFAEEEQFGFVPSEAASGALPLTPALKWHFFRKPSDDATPEEKEQSPREEAAQVRELVQQAILRGEQKIAVLVRARRHAGLIMKELRDAAIPYRAIEMEFLGERQEVLDIFALTRALLHPADRTAWLSVLRAPWCGLSLASLEALTQADAAGRYVRPSLAELLPQNLKNLSEAERLRAEPVCAILMEAWKQRDQMRLPQLLWRTWQQLGGPACVNAEQYKNVEAYFALLEKQDTQGQPWNMHLLSMSLGKLFAQPNPDPSARVEVLTIHKAKGLGFDVVIVPHLDRKGAQDKAPAIGWLEEETDDGVALFVAPIAATGRDASPLSTWIRDKKQLAMRSELKRLFYVAATRARHQLHLLGSVAVRGTVPELVPPDDDTLLKMAWGTIDQRLVWEQILRPGVEERIAATGTVVTFPNATKPAKVRRLPDAWRAAHSADKWLTAAPAPLPDLPVEDGSFGAERFTASAETRARGVALHSLLEQAARQLAEGKSFDEQMRWAADAGDLIRRLLAVEGISQQKSKAAAPYVQKLLQTTLASATGRWVLAPRPSALTEFPLTYWEDGTAYALRLDRVFPGGREIGQIGDDTLWIVDYKSIEHSGLGEDAFLAAQVNTYAPTMQRYARAWRALRNDERPVRCALYFPAQDKLIVMPEPA